MNTKQNRPSEEEIVVSALPNWSSKMIKLFSKKVQVIPALKSVVSSGKVLMSTGAIVSETFTVINVGRRQHFTFKVSKRLNISITVLSLPDIYYSSPVQTVIIVWNSMIVSTIIYHHWLRCFQTVHDSWQNHATRSRNCKQIWRGLRSAISVAFEILAE